MDTSSLSFTAQDSHTCRVCNGTGEELHTELDFYQCLCLDANNWGPAVRQMSETCPACKGTGHCTQSSQTL